jgi:hypothetical protein
MRHDVVRAVCCATFLFTASCLGSVEGSAESQYVCGEVGGAPDDGGAPTADDTGSAAPGDTAGGVDAGAPATKPGAASPSSDATPSSDAATSSPAPTTPAAPTFTDLYSTIFASTSNPSNCTGSSCHAPGKQKGLDYSTKAVGFTTTMKFVVAGAPDSSSLVSVLTSGSMPQGRPKISAADLARVRAWVTAGAKND